MTSNEINDILNTYINNDSGIVNVTFVNLPFSLLGEVFAVAELDNHDFVFVAIHDVPYYNGIELGAVYTLDEINEFLKEL